MIYRPADMSDDESRPYGGSAPAWPHGPESTATVFSDENREFGCWGFIDPDWRDADGTVRGQFRLNVDSPTGHGHTGSDQQTQTFSAPADRLDLVMGTIQQAISFAREDGRREGRQEGQEAPA